MPCLANYKQRDGELDETKMEVDNGDVGARPKAGTQRRLV
jgi:hypothetical protein